MVDNTPDSAILYEPAPGAIVPERRQRIEGNMTGREIRLYGTPHDVNRLMGSCRETLRAAEARGNFEEVYLVQVDPPHEEER